ncbi:type II toxin-antitoxin system YafQ family toxin [Helicobacter sp. MIT 11-5569]|uniref:type II toxin-antitoxin system RelE/ParE family toxin n=1 Tax=Helicobacter sp. MIT 11-5569 TaxID=1548151 RepID=UPI00051FBDCF|nr:type II toxin-antitoxin system YafQ family toxin [Helicobacter sp. MIT 11-5569]TLD83265.1 type II toxin-antitoxin system YafQ family toxin [Helicobacter sp. MIT 11-5569]
MFEIHTSAKYKKQRKKLALNDRILLDDIVYKLANNQTLEQKHKDHKLKGELKGFRECHIRPNLLLIYQLQKDILVLTCIEVGSHSELFGG